MDQQFPLHPSLQIFNRMLVPQMYHPSSLTTTYCSYSPKAQSFESTRTISISMSLPAQTSPFSLPILFYGFTILEWAWAEEPFKIVWAIRSDGAMLTLTFLKEQDFVGWTHSITQGSFMSVATVTENTSTAGEVDAIYTVVQRTVQGQTLQYIERVVERTFPNGVVDAWCVDCGNSIRWCASYDVQQRDVLGRPYGYWSCRWHCHSAIRDASEWDIHPRHRC